MLGGRPEVYFGRKPMMMTYISFPKVTSEDYEDDVYSDMTSMVPKIGVTGSKKVLLANLTDSDGTIVAI